MFYVTPPELMQAQTRGFERDNAALQRTALRELDHYFAFMLLREMGKAVPRDTLFGAGLEQEVYEEMLFDALSAEIAKTGRLGVARQVEAQLEAAGKLRSVQEGQAIKKSSARADKTSSSRKMDTV